MKLTKRQIEKRLQDLEADIAISGIMDSPPDYYEMLEERGRIQIALQTRDYRQEYSRPLPECDGCGYRFREFLNVHKEDLSTWNYWTFCSFECLAKKGNNLGHADN